MVGLVKILLLLLHRQLAYIVSQPEWAPKWLQKDSMAGSVGGSQVIQLPIVSDFQKYVEAAGTIATS